MAKNIKAYKHADKRSHTPSTEEAGMEQNNPKVKGKEELDISKNPVVHRGQTPELMWKDKYGADDNDTELKVDIRSLYRHEHISPELLVNSLYKMKKDVNASGQPTLFDVFGNSFEIDELEKPTSYYTHQDGWSNRLIQGDSLLVMTSLLEREGMAGKVQCFYFDPPYGIKYGSNWQMQLNKRDVKDGNDDYLTGEPEMIKAYRDTWELGIHSYLSYMRDRLLVAKQLLTESGSCFVQISDENVHLVRNLMDEVFGSENFVSLITVKKTGLIGQELLDGVSDYIIWYSKMKEQLKYRQLYNLKTINDSSTYMYNLGLFKDGSKRKLTKEEIDLFLNNNFDGRPFRATALTSQSGGDNSSFEVEFEGKKFKPSVGFWKTNQKGFENLIEKERLMIVGNRLNYIRFLDDFPAISITNLWDNLGGASNKKYVVQTNEEIIKRCILMSTDPGDF